MTLITLIITDVPAFNYVIYESWKKLSLTRTKKTEIIKRLDEPYLLSVKAHKIDTAIHSLYIFAALWIPGPIEMPLNAGCAMRAEIKTYLKTANSNILKSPILFSVVRLFISALFKTLSSLFYSSGSVGVNLKFFSFLFFAISQPDLSLETFFCFLPPVVFFHLY